MKSPNTALQTNTRHGHAACYLRPGRPLRATSVLARASFVRATRQAARPRRVSLSLGSFGTFLNALYHGNAKVQ